MHGGFGMDYIVFYGWNPRNAGALVASCFALAFIAIFYEALKSFRINLKERKDFKRVADILRKSVKLNHKDSHDFVTQDSQKSNITNAGQSSYFKNLLSFDHIVQTLIHVIQFTISYFLMLAFMTFNYWLCLSIIVGIGIGYFLFGVQQSKPSPTGQQINSCAVEDCH